MPVREVLLFHDPRLRQAAVPVDFYATDWRDDVRDLSDTLAHLQRTHGFGRALAGPQIGSRFRMIAIDCDLGTFVAINPTITWRSDARRLVQDDCFSFPNQTVDVLRHESVSVAYHTQDGTAETLPRLPFDQAELLQHEIDHLDGILMTDRADI